MVVIFHRWWEQWPRHCVAEIWVRAKWLTDYSTKVKWCERRLPVVNWTWIILSTVEGKWIKMFHLATHTICIKCVGVLWERCGNFIHSFWKPQCLINLLPSTTRNLDKTTLCCAGIFNCAFTKINKMGLSLLEHRLRGFESTRPECSPFILPSFIF